MVGTFPPKAFLADGSSTKKQFLVSQKEHVEVMWTGLISALAHNYFLSIDKCT